MFLNRFSDRLQFYKKILSWRSHKTNVQSQLKIEFDFKRRADKLLLSWENLKPSWLALTDLYVLNHSWTILAHWTWICCIILNHQLSWTIKIQVLVHGQSSPIWINLMNNLWKSWFNINANTGLAGVEWPYIIFRCHHNSLCVLYPDAISHVFHIFEEKSMGNTFLLCHIFKNTMTVHNMLYF